MTAAPIQKPRSEREMPSLCRRPFWMLEAPIRFRPTHVVSLGYRCATAHNTRRVFGTSDAYPFDWWITRADTAVANIIRQPDVDSLYDPDFLQITENGASVENQAAGVIFHHEFPRENGEGSLIRSDFRDHIQEPKSRTAHLLKKLLELDRPGNSVLFFRERLRGSAIADALRVRFQRAQWRLLPVHGPEEDRQWGWQGNPCAWDRVFIQLLQDNAP